MNLEKFYIYVLDDGRGLYTSKEKLNFNDAWKQMQRRTMAHHGFNYLRRIGVVDGEITCEQHLTPINQDGD